MNRVTVSGRHVAIDWDAASDVKLRVEIYRYGGRLTILSCERHMEITVDEDGVYRFIAYKELGNHSYQLHSDEIVDVFSEETRNHYERFISAELPPQQQLPYYPYRDPFQDFAICINVSLCESEDFLRPLIKTKYNDTTVLFSTIPPKEVQGRKVLLSGYVFSGGKWIFGNQDVEDLNNLAYNQEGCYARVMYNDKEISVDTDYFGTHTIYIYHQKNQWIIANHYHFLLKLVSLLCPKGLTIRNDYIGITMSAFSGLNEYPFDDGTLFQEIRALSIYKRISIREGDVTFLESDLYFDTSSREKISPQLYGKKIQEIGESIIEKLEAISRDDRIDEISTDLTGGVDSRCVFAALSRCKDKRKFSYYNSARKTDDEFTIPLTLSAVLGIPFDYDRKEQRHAEDFREFLMKKMSLSMHRLLDPNLMFQQYCHEEKKVRLNGADAGFRASYLMDIVFPHHDFVYCLENLKRRMDEDDWKWLDVTLEGFAICGREEADKLKASYHHSIESLSGYDFEKIEKSYFQRARFHYSSVRDGGYGALMISPLLSKKIPKLFYSTFGDVDGLHVEFSVLFSLNAFLGMHRFKNEKYNRYVLSRYSSISKTLIQNQRDTEEFERNWKKLRKERDEQQVNEAHRLYAAKNDCITKKPSYMKYWCLELLHYIVRELKDDRVKNIMFYIWFFLDEKLSADVPPVHNRSVYMFFLRLANIAYQIREVEHIPLSISNE